MRKPETNEEDREATTFAAMAWILADGGRADRLLALTGLDAAALRARIGDPSLHEAVRAFLAAHQPDLVACAAALGVAPEALLPRAEEMP